MRFLIRMAFLFLLLGTSVSVYATPATRFIVNCIPAISPPPGTQCFNHVVGQQFTLWVVAVDANGQLATNYAGTAHITSSDPVATLPPDHTFTANDGSLFQFALTFNSVTSGSVPSPETITATDTANGLSGVGTFFVSILQPSVSAPTLSAISLLLLATFLNLLGFHSLWRMKS